MNVKSLDAAPTLRPEAAWIYSAFEVLSSKRLNIDRRPQPIQLSEILAYADFEEIDDKTMRDDLLYMVGVLDAKFLDFHVNKSHNKPDKTGKTPRRR